MANPTTLRKRKAKTTAHGPGRKDLRLRAHNKELLRWLDSWLSTPDDRGETWWNEFEADLQSQPLTLRPTNAG